jgi:lysophospholipase L1-like esterase
MITFEDSFLKKDEKLLCFGDSITASQTGYVKILQDRLRKLDIEVINAGRGGDKTTWALTRLQNDVIKRKPDAVSIFLGANDAAVGRGKWADEPIVSPEAYRCNLVWIIHLCRMAGIEKFSITPPLYRFEGKNWAELGDIMVPYRLAAREAADEMKARFVPADIAFAEEWDRHPGHTGLLLTTDGTHLTPKGNQIVAKTMLETWGIG